MRRMVFSILKAGTGNFFALALGAISMKILAVIAGPSGVGLFSLLRSMQQTLSTFISFGGQTAIVQTLPGKSTQAQSVFVVSVFWALALGSALVAIGCAIFSDLLATKFLNGAAGGIVLWLILPAVIGAFFFYFRAILTAHLEIGIVAWANVLVAFVSLVLVVPVALSYQDTVASVLIFLLAIPLGMGVTFALVMVCKRRLFVWPDLFDKNQIEWSSIKAFLRLAFPSLLVGLVATSSMLLIRSMVARLYGFSGAGYFDAAWSISAMYVMLFLPAMQSYLLPSMSAERVESQTGQLLDQAARLVLIVSVPLIATMIVFKPLILRVLYSGEFSQTIGLLRWSFLGDYFRILGWVLATYLLARMEMKAYVVHEILWNLVFVFGGMWLLNADLSGAGIAYLLAYSAYLASLVIRVYVLGGVRIDFSIAKNTIAGGLIILATAAVTWNSVTVEWSGVVAMLLAGIFSVLIMRPSERLYVKRAVLDRLKHKI